MTIADVIAEAGRYRPNHVATDEEIIKWLARLDGQAFVKVIDTCADAPVYEPYTIETERNTELLIKAPYEDIYRHFILAEIDLLQRDTESYSTERALLDSAYTEWAGDYVRTHKPLRKPIRYW